MESDNRPIRNAVIVDQFSRSIELVSQRHEITNGRSRSNILEVRSTLRRQALLPILLQLGVSLWYAGVKLLEFLGVPTICRDGLVDGPHDGIVPKRGLFRRGTEASHVTRAVSGCRERGKIVGWAGRVKSNGSIHSAPLIQGDGIGRFGSFVGFMGVKTHNV